MSKKRQTRKQKLVAQSRKESQASIFQIQKTSYSLPVDNTASLQSPKIYTDNNYSYVLKDTQNTLIITLFLLLANSVIFVLLQKRLISIPFLGF